MGCDGYVESDTEDYSSLNLNIMKIVYCTNTIRYLGGIQKVTIVKANALAEISGNEVYILVTDNKDGVFTEKLSSKVHLIDLDINYFADDWKGRLYNLKGIILKKRLHKKRLRQALNEIQPDFVISTGLSEKFILPSIKGNWKIVRELHSHKNYRLDHAINWFDRMKAHITNFYDYGYMIKKYDQILVLTIEDKENSWKKTDKVSVIPNPSTFKTERISDLSAKKVISVGRLCPSKNYESLIRSFRLVVNKFPDWVLEIFGEGESRPNLEKLIAQLELEKNVYLKGKTLTVDKELISSSIFAMTSLSEGFGLVLVEAMTCGLPVVSYSCPCGPKDIITNDVDGFLVSINDEVDLANKMMLLISEEEKRKTMGKNAVEKSKLFHVDFVVSKIMDLLCQIKQ